MTIDDAIAELKDIYNNAIEHKDARTQDAFNMAIDALEKLTMCNEIIDEWTKSAK